MSTATNDDLDLLHDEPETNEPLQAPKKEKEAPIKIDRRRREHYTRTEKQNEAFKGVQAIRNQKREERKAQRIQEEEENQKILEEKIVKKAIILKKRQILKEKILNDTISDSEDIPIEIINKLRNKTPKKKDIEVHELPSKPLLPSFVFI